MTLQQLKEKIIHDETQFIIDLFNDESITQEEYTERALEIVSGVNSCQTPDDLICFYMNNGYSEKVAYQTMFYFLITKD